MFSKSVHTLSRVCVSVKMSALCRSVIQAHQIKIASPSARRGRRSRFCTYKLMRRYLYVEACRLIDSLRAGRVQREIEPRLCWRTERGRE